MSTSLGFAFRSGGESDLSVFSLALLVMLVLVGLQRSVLWVLARVDVRRA